MCCFISIFWEFIFAERPTPHDPQWKGPLKNRSCTDIPCLMVFIIFMVCWGAVGYYAFKHGDIQTFLAPTDSEGRKCGIDSEVSDTPYLVFFDLTKCFNSRCNTPQVCVRKCPSTNWRYDPSITNTNSLKQNLLCKTGLKLDGKTSNDLKTLIIKNACASWYLKSFPVVGRCLPKSIPEEFVDAINEKQLQQAREIIDYLYKAQEILDKIISTKENVIWFICASGLMCLIFIISLKWIALPCVFVSIFGVVALLVYLASLSYKEYEQETIEANKWNGYRIIAMILAGLAGIIVLFTCCLWSRVYLACQLIKEASK